MSERAKSISGAVPIIPVPFDLKEAVDESALQRLIDFSVECRVNAVCLPAYGSEFYKLSEKERVRVVEIAAERAVGRIQVVAQCNHGSSRIARNLAKANLQAGADLISIAIPRQFPLSDEDLLRYLAPVLNAASVPYLVQDFNPGGPTLDVAFLTRLLAECPNFTYLKLEEPLSAPKIAAIIKATQGRVKILTGWGGLYLLELIPAGICGLMPGLALSDLLNRIFFLAKEGNIDKAFYFFEKIAPMLFFSLQNMELYHHCEKNLLVARGILSNARCRHAAYQPDGHTTQHLEVLTQRTLLTLEEAGLSKFGPLHAETIP